MANADQSSLTTAIDKLHAAALDPTEWRYFLSFVASMFNAQNVVVDKRAHGRPSPEYIGLPRPNENLLPVKRHQGLTDEDLMTLQRVFSFSPSQTRVAMAIYNGRTVKEAAADLGLKEGSVRQYLKIIFEKTGTHRQVDLVRLIGDTLAR